MRKIDMSTPIKKQITLLGKSCAVVMKNGDTTSVTAIIDPVWPRSKSRFEGIYTELGELTTDYSIYIGPCDFDITRLGRNDTVIYDNREYYFVRADKCIVGDIVQFCTGVLKRVYKGDEYGER